MRNENRLTLFLPLLALVLLGQHLVAVAGNGQQLDTGDITGDGTVKDARGGTELMSEMLMDRLPSFFNDRFHIIKTRVRDVATDRKNVLWVHDLPEDGETQHLRDPASRQMFDKIIFVSEWQRQAYMEYFDAPFENGVVLRNAIVPLPVQPKDRGQIRLIYHTTPHRGLDILIYAFLQLYQKYGDAIILDVYSSFNIYGWGHRDPPFEHLFETCRQHPGCHYHGAVSNNEVREALLKSHIFAYPSTWAETSCIAAIEALSAGCEIVTSNLGALPETLNGFGTMYQYTSDKDDHLKIFTQKLDGAIASFWDPALVKKRKMQQIYAANAYDWGFFGFKGRIDEWTQVLASLDNDLVSSSVIPTRSSFETQAKFVQGLITAGRMSEVKRNPPRAMQLYERAFELEPHNSHVLVALGNLCLLYGDSVQMPGVSEQGVRHLEFVLSSDTVRPLLSFDSDVFFEMAVRIGFYRSSRYQDALAFHWFDKAFESSYPREDCWELGRAGSVPHIPRSEAEEKQNIASFHERVDAMMERDDLMCGNTNAFANAFPLAYYDINFKEEL